MATAQGRKKWLEAARRRLDAEREQEARPIPQPRPARVREAKRRLEEELATEVRANAAYETHRAQGRMKNGRRFGSPPRPTRRPSSPSAASTSPIRTHGPTHIPPVELDFLGARCRILAGTGGRYGLVDMIEVPAGDMPPLHLHHAQDEGFLLLDRELTLFLPGRELTLRPGEFVLAPRGVAHTYRVGDAPARLLVLSTPGGFEQFVSDVAALNDLSPHALGATAARHDIEILGPPGAMP